MKIIDNLIKWFQEELRDCKTVLDLGCGPDSIIQFVDTVSYSVGIDYWEPSVKRSCMRGIHDLCFQGDITNVTYPENSFDAVILVDVLEHLTIEEGMKLLNDMTQWARKKVIVVVPNGELAQDIDAEGNEKQKHMSAWCPATMESFGFKVRGFDGWKPLRWEHGNIIPTRTQAGHYALSALSLLSDPFVRNRPNMAFHLFAVWEKRHPHSSASSSRSGTSSISSLSKAQQSRCAGGGRCEFELEEYCCIPKEYSGFKCSRILPLQPGDITNKCGCPDSELMTDEEWVAQKMEEKMRMNRDDREMKGWQRK